LGGLRLNRFQRRQGDCNLYRHVHFSSTVRSRLRLVHRTRDDSNRPAVVVVGDIVPGVETNELAGCDAHPGFAPLVADVSIAGDSLAAPVKLFAEWAVGEIVGEIVEGALEEVAKSPADAQ